MSVEQDQRFADLLSDVLSVDACDPELVVRYDEAPESLTEAERAEVEAYLAESPAHGDALSAMRNIVDQGLLELPAADQAQVRSETTSMPETPIDLAAERKRRRALRDWSLPITVLAAGLVGLLLYNVNADRRGGAPEQPIAEVPSPSPYGTPPRGVDPTTGAKEPNALIAERTPAVEEVGTPSSEEMQVPTPQAIAREPAPSESEDAPQAIAHEPSPAESEDVPRSISQPRQRLARDEAPPRRTETPGKAPTSAPEQEVVLLAMVSPSYVAPSGMTMDRMLGAMRNTGDVAPPTVISPDHYGLTSTETPELYWFLERLPETPRELRLTIASEEDDEPLVDVALPAPERPGLQRIALADIARLEPDRAYIWSVAIRIDIARPSQDLMSFGWIRYQAMSEEQAAAVEHASVEERPAVQARLGYFYDAFSSLATVRREQPDNASVRDAQRALLEQVGLELPGAPG